jgi:hypothetical protein
MAISNLTATDTIVAGDQLAVGKTSAGDDRRAAMSVLLAYIQANITHPDTQLTTQYAAPSATGFNIAITDGDDSIHLILTPTAGFAAGTITLPAVANAVDKQVVLVNCTQAVTTLTVDGNGATAVTGEPASLSANDFFKLKYDIVSKTWYRVG